MERKAWAVWCSTDDSILNHGTVALDTSADISMPLTVIG